MPKNDQTSEHILDSIMGCYHLFAQEYLEVSSEVVLLKYERFKLTYVTMYV